ncbi:MAG: MOP flippase family protein [Actinobacteria bacterium]|nr:MOP flippase family protein [Actinomycetota bacterium]
MTSSLKSRAASGVKWTTVSTAVSTTMQYLKIAVLARLLSTSDFGLMGMTLVIINLAYYMVDLGISGAIIYRQDSTDEELSTLYWINLLFGSALFLLAVLCSPLVVAFFHEPALYSLIFISAFNFLLFPAGLQFGVLMQKELQFKRLALVEITSSTFGAAVAIILAIAGAGVYSLVFGYLAETTMRSIVLIIIGWSHWHPGLHFRARDAKRYLSFGLFQVGDRITTYLASNVDYIWIGRFLGPELLGIYTLVYNLIVNPITRINPIITKVAFPVFAKKQDDKEALQRGYGEISRLLAFLVFPILIGISITSPVFIPIIFGSKWLPAVPLLQVMVIMGLFKTLFNPIGSVIYARGRAGLGFAIASAMAITNTVVFWFAARQGLTVLSWSWVAVSCFYYLLSLFILHKEIGLKYRKYSASLWSPLVFNAVMAGVTYLLYLLLEPVMGGTVLFLVLLILAGAIIYGSLILLFQRDYLLENFKLLLGRS